MKKLLVYSLFLIIVSASALAQDVTETDTDKILKLGLTQYKDQEFKTSLKLAEHGLALAPEYHDIRILKVRNLWALKESDLAETELLYLIENATNYPDVKELALRQSKYYSKPTEAIDYLDKVLAYYPGDNSIKTRKASLLLKNRNVKDARTLALATLKNKNLSSEDQYQIQNILKRTITDEVGVNYQYLGFSDDYSRDDPWHTISANYQHSFNQTVVLARLTYTDRSYDSGTLYELEAYPVFSDKFYMFTNIGFSDGSLFPDFRSSISMYYNFAKYFEVEAGGRLLHFNDEDFLTGILGLTTYVGKFYLNTRAFIGPERADKLVQNYQFNLRYYLKDADNYFFTRIGSGISPDERTIFTQVQDNPELKAYYINAGLNKSVGIHHLFQLGAGYLFEDITSDKQGQQFVGTVGYSYRF